MVSFVFRLFVRTIALPDFSNSRSKKVSIFPGSLYRDIF